MPIDVKICGLATEDAVAAAVEGGARFVGFVFFPPSPRAIAPRRMAELAAAVPAGVTKAGLTVDADDALLDAIVEGAPVDLLQLHGTESPERVREVKRKFGLPVMKAVTISSRQDVDMARAYEDAADRLLFDAQAPEGATRPGGNALVFDWQIVGSQVWRLPWMLAGGLEAANLSEAVRISGAPAVDVSSGVEDAPGVKNAAKIREFLETAAKL